jgi:hypothetical protein
MAAIPATIKIIEKTDFCKHFDASLGSNRKTQVLALQ